MFILTLGDSATASSTAHELVGAALQFVSVPW